MWAKRRARARRAAIARRLVAVVLLLASAETSRAIPRSEAEAVTSATAPADGPTPFDRPLVLQAHRLRGLRGEIVKLILTAEDGGELALAALAAPFQGGGETTRVPLFVEIDGASFLRHNQAPVARLEIYAYALGEQGRVAGYLAEVLAVDVRGVGETVWQSGLKYFGALELSPGSYTLRILVRNAQSGARGLVSRLLTVPTLSDDDERAIAPVFPDPPQRDCWLPIRPGSAGTAAAAAPFPFVADGQAHSPAARPVLVAERATDALIFGQPLPAGTIEGSLQLFDAAAGDGRVVAEADLQELGRGVTPGGLDWLSVRVTPPELTPGEYLFRVRLTGARGETGSSPVASLWLLAESTRERQLIWSDLRWLMSSSAGGLPPPPRAATSGAAEPPQRARGGRRVRALARDYLQAVSGLLSQPPETVRSALLELESSALGRADRSARVLRDAELKVARELAKNDAQALLPLVTMHEALYRAYRGRHLFSLVQHSRAQVERLAELFVAHGGSAKIAADILAGIGSQLQEANLPAESRRLLSRALEHDPANVPALFSMATSHEKYGEYLRATEYLERLGVERPNDEESNLRLAMNLYRTGRQRRFEELLSAMIERCSPSWTCALAHQELARSWLESGSEERAAALLERGIGRMPERHGLRFLLAHAYDRLGQPNSATEVISDVTPGDTRSERLRYDSWSNGFLEEARRSLADLAGEARSALGQAVAEIAVQEKG